MVLNIKQRRNRWWLQLTGIYKRGYQAHLEGKQEADNPYSRAAPGSTFNGVQVQRWKSWERGRRRAELGLPIDDSNG